MRVELYDSKRLFVAVTLLILGGSSSALPAESAARTRQPNIILILADDAGRETVGAYGGELRTPRIDAMARQGLRFENAHATPLCTPSRVRLLTGKYSFRNYKAFGQLDPAQPTIAKALKQVGYRTAAVGKWQLAGNPLDGVPGATPRDAGFDEWRLWAAGRNFMADGCQHWSPTLDTNGDRATFPGEFGSDLVHAAALEFVGRDAQQPFFLYYAMILPHDPWVPTPARPNVVSREDKFAAMMEYLDSQVGALLDFLDAKALSENTMVIFLADNGTHPALRVGFRGGIVTGGKGSTLATGTHVPLIIRWPGQVAAATTSRDMVDLTDVFATIATAAGAADALGLSDGHDLLRRASDPTASARAGIFMDYAPDWWPLRPERYAFTDRWKLYGDGRFFDVASDLLEQHPIVEARSAPGGDEARRSLEQLLANMGDRPMSKTDPHFPPGFDPETVDLKSAQRQLQDNIAYCGDPARMRKPAN